MKTKTWTPDNSFLLRYKAEIEEGKIIVGQDMYQGLKNLAEDIRSNDECVYDTDDALLRMDFMENVIRLTKSPFYGMPMKLLLWQKAFIEANNRTVVTRGSGKITAKNGIETDSKLRKIKFNKQITQLPTDPAELQGVTK